MKQFDLYTLMDGCTFPPAGICNVLQLGTLCSNRGTLAALLNLSCYAFICYPGTYTILLVYLNLSVVMVSNSFFINLEGCLSMSLLLHQVNHITDHIALKNQEEK